MVEKTEPTEMANAYDPYLIQISGRETGQMYCLANQTLRIGRDPTCQIILDDPHVSRFHAEIFSRSNSEVIIQDLGSTNGIQVNGTKTLKHTLLDGDKIRIGTRHYFKFCYQDAVDQSYQQQLFHAANIDGLTQLYNKKYFIDAFSKEFSFSRRNHQALSLLMIDVDHFKNINDTHGHMAGDLVLKRIGQYCLQNLRLENIACRYGGEEFAIILRNVSAEVAETVAERIRKGIEKEKIQFRNTVLTVTISLGIATFANDNFETIEDMIQQADSFLYQAKQNGRNRSVSGKKAA